MRSLVEDFGHDERSAGLRAEACSRAFAADGRVPRTEADAAVAALAERLGVAAVRVDALYDPAALS